MQDSTLSVEASKALRKHVLEPLVPRIVDQDFGGFLVDFDTQWRLVGTQAKSLEHAARTTMAFGLIDHALPGQGYERFLLHGCDFLQNAMYDREHGGFFARVDRSGKALWDGLKHPHAVTYTAQAFMLGARYMPPGEGQKWADRALAWLADVAWDPANGGYWGSYRRNNERYGAGVRLPTPDGRDIFGLVPGFKEINTQGDAVEMLTWAARARPNAATTEQLSNLMNLVIGKLLQPAGVLPYRYWPDWHPAPDLLRVGYQFLMARHLCEAAHVVEVPGVLDACCSMVDFCLTSARHPGGGFTFAVSADGRSWPSTSKSTDQRQWWAQLEGIQTLNLLAKHDGVDPALRARYSKERDELWEFVKTNLFDNQNGGIHGVPRKSGTLYRLLSKRSGGGDIKDQKAHCWKDAIHETTTFLSLMEHDEDGLFKG